jgi:hypothetical protein
MHGRLSELERKIGRLTGLSPTAIFILLAAVASKGAIFPGAAAEQFPI